MAFQVFLVPSVRAEDRASILQLQQLAESYVIILRAARRSKHTRLSKADAAEIGKSDAVMAIVTKPLSLCARAELAEARRHQKQVYFLVDHCIANSLKSLHENVIVFDRDEGIHQVAQRVQKVLNREKASKETRTATGWLLGIGAALLIFGALAGEPD